MFVLDTNILSELIRKRPSPHLVKRLKGTGSGSLFTTSITVMELRYGASLRNNHKELWERIQADVLSRLETLGFDQREAVLCGDLLAALEQEGTPIGIEDVMIGSIALSHGCTLVTGNIRHFERIPSLKVENWLTP